MRLRLPGLALAGVLLIATAGVMAQAEADRRLDAALDRLRAALGPGMRLTIGGRQVDPVTGHAVLTDVVLTDGRGTATIPEVRVQDVTETRLGRAELLRMTIRSPEGGTGGIARVLVAGFPIPAAAKSLDPLALSFDTLEIEAAQMEDAARGAIRLGRLAVGAWRPDGVAAASLEGFEFRGGAPDNQVMRIGRIAAEAVALPVANGAFAPLAFRAGRIAIEGAEVREPAQDVTVALESLALQDWIPGRATALSLQGLRVAAPASAGMALDMRLGRAELSGVDAAGTLAAVLSGVQVPDPFPGVPQGMTIEALEAGLNGEAVFALGRFSSDARLDGGIATGAATLEGIRITPPRGQADWLAGLGYREIAGGIELRGSMQRAGGPLEIAPFRITWQEGATLALQARLEGMPPAPAPGTAVDPAGYGDALAAGQVASLALSLRDHGLLGRVLTMQARQQRVPEARLREQWAQMAMALPLPGAPPQAKGAGPDPMLPVRQALAAFIRQPGTLEIAARPAKPIPFTDLMGVGGGNPAETIARLGISVVHR
jgi:hypothetical protein